MKIIELLNKIANNENVPKKIKVSCYEFEWRGGGRYYANTTKGNYQTLLQDWLNNANKLNSEVEIIEDEEEIDIQSIEEMNATFNGNSSLIDVEKQTINELVKAVKQLDKKVNSIEQK
jgi:hypothetical protein